MYFSKKNKNYIFDIIRNLVLKETGEDINSRSDYVDLYRFKYALVFERSVSDNLIDLNKSLIDVVTPLYINDIKSKYEEQSRVQDKRISGTLDPLDPLDPLEEKQKEFYINSSERLVNSINRYEYIVKIPQMIKSIGLKDIYIPIENNSLFSNPIICVQIEIQEERYDIYCIFKKDIVLNNKKYNIYKPSQDLIIPSSVNIKISILTSILSKVTEKTDIVSIYKFKNLAHDTREYLCIKIKDNNDININDTIGIYSNHRIIKTMIVTNKVDNNLLIENETFDADKDKEYYFYLKIIIFIRLSN